MKKLLSIVLMLLPLVVMSQVVDSSRTNLKLYHEDSINHQWITHMTIGTGLSFNSIDAHGYTFVAPSFSKQVNNRVKVHGGFGMIFDNADKFRIRGYNAMNLAPRRSSNMLASGHASAQYKVSDRLWVAGAVSFLAGQYDPFWNFSSQPLNVRALEFSAAMGYQFDSGNSINLFLHVVRDQAGTLPLWFYDPWINPYYSYGLNSSWINYSPYNRYAYDMFAPPF